MPRRDGTGPQGKGPATGRGLGGCKKNSKTKKSRPRLGLGRRSGRGRRR